MKLAGTTALVTGGRAARLGERAEVVVPRWLRLPVVFRAAAPQAYATLSGRFSGRSAGAPRERVPSEPLVVTTGVSPSCFRQPRPESRHHVVRPATISRQRRHQQAARSRTGPAPVRRRGKPCHGVARPVTMVRLCTPVPGVLVSHTSDISRIVHLPARSRLARDVAQHLGEAVVVPLALFYGLVVGLGLAAALIAALAWVAAAVGVRAVRGTRPPTVLWAATGMAAVQVAVTFAASSATAYFLQPTLATFVFAAALLASRRLDRPLIQRLANDFCPLPPDVAASAPLRRFFQRLSLLWASVLAAQAGLTLGFLLTVPVTWSVPVSGALSLPVFAVGLVASYLWFRRSLREGGFVLRWGNTAAT